MGKILRVGTLFTAIAAGVLALAPAAARADKIYVGGAGTPQIEILDHATNTVMATIPTLGTGIGQIVAAPNGSPFVFACERGNGTIVVIDHRFRGIFTRIPISIADPFRMEMTPDGRWLFVTTLGAGPTISVINVKNFIEAAVISLAGQGADGALRIAIQPNGTMAFVVAGFSGGFTTSTLHAIQIPKKGNPSLVGAPFPRILPPTVSLVAGFVPQNIGIGGNFVYVGDLVTAGSDILGVYNIKKGFFTTLPLPVGGADGTAPISIATRPGGPKTFVCQPGLARIQVINNQRNTLTQFVDCSVAAGGPGMAPNWLDVRTGAQWAWFADNAANTISRVDIGNLGFPFQDTNQDGLSPDPIAMTEASFLAIRPDFPGKGALPVTDPDGERLADALESPMVDTLITVLRPADREPQAAPAPGSTPGAVPTCLLYGIAAALGCIALTLRQAVVRD